MSAEDDQRKTGLPSSGISVDNTRQWAGTSNLLYFTGEGIFAIAGPPMRKLGWSVWPQERLDGKRRPSRIDGKVFAWGELQDRLPTDDEMAAFRRDAANANVAVALGAGSGHSFALDIDCMDKAVSERVQEIARTVLGETPFLRIGRAPKAVLIYRYAPGDPPRSRSLPFQGRSDCTLEVLGPGKALTMYGLHHVTGRWFQWVEGIPLSHGPDEATVVSAADVDRFLAAVEAEFPFERPTRAERQPAPMRVPVPAGGDHQGGDLVVPGRPSGAPLTDGREAFLRDLAWNTVRLNGQRLLAAREDGTLHEARKRIEEAVATAFHESCEVTGRWTGNGLADAVETRVGSALEKLMSGEMTAARAGAQRGAHEEADEKPITEEDLFADREDLRQAFSDDLEDLDFVLPGLLTGTVGVLVSAGGTGKSMLSLGLAACVATGRNLWNLLPSAPKQGPVIVVSAEDRKILVFHRVRAMGHLSNGGALLKDDDKFFENMILKNAQGSAFSMGMWGRDGFAPSRSFEILRREILAAKPRLVIFDTLNRTLAGIPENDNGALGRIIVEIESILSPVGAAGLLLHHVSKGAAREGADEQQAARGAGAITDNARWQSNLIGMTADEARTRGVPDEERQRWVRWVVTKSNGELKPPEKWLWKEAKGTMVAREPPSIRIAKLEKGRAQATQAMPGRRGRATDD